MKNKNWGKSGLILLCLLSMGSYTLAQELSGAYLWLTAVLAGSIVGWFIGSGQWRSLGQDLVSALVSVVCIMFGSVLPIIAIGQTAQPTLWVAGCAAALIALVGGIKLCRSGEISESGSGAQTGT